MHGNYPGLLEWLRHLSPTVFWKHRTNFVRRILVALEPRSSRALVWLNSIGCLVSVQDTLRPAVYRTLGFAQCMCRGRDRRRCASNELGADKRDHIGHVPSRSEQRLATKIRAKIVIIDHESKWNIK